MPQVSPARSELEVTFDRCEPSLATSSFLGRKIGDLMSSRSAQILETSVSAVNPGQAAISFNFLIPLLVVHGMHVFAREKGIDIMKGRIEQYGDRPVNTNGEIAIKGQVRVAQSA